MEPKKTLELPKIKKAIGYVQNGKLKHDIIDPNVRAHREHPLHRQYVRDRMLEDYGRDVIQPYRQGKPNPAYIEAWGRETVEQFGEQGIRQAMEE
jgi:hypothetical protein